MESKSTTTTDNILKNLFAIDVQKQTEAQESEYIVPFILSRNVPDLDGEIVDLATMDIS